MNDTTYVEPFYASLSSFFNSTFFQTCVLIVTLIGTLSLTRYLYNKKVKESIKAATTILILQIKNIERNIEYLKAHGITGTAINETPLHYSIPIFEENAWEKYKHLYATKLSSSDFSSIEKFYETALAIRTTQLFIKRKIEESLYAKANCYYNMEYNRVNMSIIFNEVDNARLFNDIDRIRSIYGAVHIQTYMPIEFYNGLSQGLNSYFRLSGTTTLDNLRKKGHLGKE